MSVAPAGLRRVFYSDSGSTAAEIALKMAFQFWQQRGGDDKRRTKFITLRNAYHGDQVNVALQWSTGYDTKTVSFVNVIATPKGGTHVTGFERALVRSLNTQLRAARLLKNGDEWPRRKTCWRASPR